MIQLAAKTLKVSVAEAISHLSCRGFNIPADDVTIRRYLRENVEYDAELNRLWANAKGGSRATQHGLYQLAGRLGLNPNGWSNEWRKTLGECLGCVSKTEIEKAFAPEVMRTAVSRNSGSQSAHRTFHGHDWDLLLTIPFYDMPGRVASFLFIGRDADRQRDFVLRRANRGTRGNQHLSLDAEAGIAMIPGIFKAADELNRTILTVSDPTLMLKFHARFGRWETRALPVCAWVDSAQWPNWQTLGRRTRTNAAWQMFSGYKTVFWCPLGLDVHTLRQAIRVDGWICMAGPRERTADAVHKYFQNAISRNLFNDLVARAVPWPTALQKHFSTSKDPVLERWLIQLEHEDEPLDPILTRCDPEFVERIDRVRKAASWSRTVQYNGQTIVEANRNWSLLQNGRTTALICDAILRTERVLKSESTGETLLSGRILYECREIPFCVPLRQLEHDALGFVKDLVLTEGSNLLRYDRRYSKHLLQIAMAFQPPQHSQPLRSVGYDQTSGQLRLPSCTLELGGRVAPKAENWVVGPLPAACLAPRAALTEWQLGALTSSLQQAKVLWATTACLIANVLAAEFGEPAAGVCLAGQGAQSVGMATALALGCLRIPVSQVADIQKAIDTEQHHAWPIVIDVKRAFPSGHSSKLLRNSDGGRRCFVATDELASRMMLLHGDWHVIESDIPMTVSEEMLQALTAFLPVYLQDLMGRHCCLQTGGNFAPLPLRLLDDIANFFEQRGADPAAILMTEEVFPCRDFSPSEILLLIIAELIRKGQLKLAQQLDKSGRPTLIDNPSKNEIRITTGTIASAFLDVPAPLLETKYIEELLESSGHLRAVRVNGWCLTRNSLFRFWRKFNVLPSEATGAESEALPAESASGSPTKDASPLESAATAAAENRYAGGPGTASTGPRSWIKALRELRRQPPSASP